MTTRFIKVKAEFVLPVPYEVRDSLDAIAESGLDMLKQLIENNVSTAIPGTVQGSWQSMPNSWRPRATPKQVLAIEEEIAPGFSHRVDAEDRVSFVEEPTITHPWDQGLSIFPSSHPLRPLEDAARASGDPAAKRAIAELTNSDDEEVQ